MPVLLLSSPSPHLKLPTWGRGRGRLGVGVWVPSRRRGWGGCGFWQWPSPAAGGHQAARVRRCGAASVAPRPETLRAKASATSSSTVGSGPGRGMKRVGPSRGPFPPRLSWGVWSWQQQGWGLQPAYLRFPCRRLSTLPRLPGIMGWVYGQPLCCSSPNPRQLPPR